MMRVVEGDEDEVRSEVGRGCLGVMGRCGRVR